MSGLRRHALEHAPLESHVLTSTASHSGPSTSGYKAAAMCVEEEGGEMSDVSPGTTPQIAHPVCSPIKLPDDFDSSSQYRLDLLFRAPAGEEEISAASEGGHEPSEADASSELTSSAAEFQLVADAEMAPVLQRAAKEIRLEWAAPPLSS
ncbi:hypothetical protein M9458_056994 [Cirrhinus mrigala]|uniref:Uncharacterized protein n=1 Tax=Cirrhinus mrigala TaxID=683832 RepID=A0ABD0MG26_CIRMR